MCVKREWKTGSRIVTEKFMPRSHQQISSVINSLPAATMAYLNQQQVPLATAIPVPEAAGEYRISRKSTDVDESQIKALKGQGYTRGKFMLR